jgi:DNA ligase (NAD+)
MGVDCVFTKVVDVANAIKGYNLYQNKKRAKLDHEIDGLVFKVNDVEKQEALGETDGRPKGQIAWKFAAEMRTTVLKDVSWEVGLTGRITPVAILKPVGIGGVTIERASLHNVGNIARLGLWIGAEVLVSRRNDVIPYVEKTIKPSTKHYPPYPKECPICGEDTEFEGEYLMCSNKDCPAKKEGDIKKWVKKLDIDEVGESFIRAAIKAGFIADPADLYTLSADTIATLDGYQSKSAKTIVRNINKTRELPLKKFMGALNIPNVGTTTFEALEKAGFDSIYILQAAAWGEFLDVDGIGETTAKAIYHGLVDKEELIAKLEHNGVKIKKKIVGKLTGKSFCFTGQISIKRGDAMKLVESMGGEIKTSVGRGLTYLVQASKNSHSGKSQKAKKYGTEILGEKEFFKLVDFSFKKLKSLQ